MKKITNILTKLRKEGVTTYNMKTLLILISILATICFVGTASAQTTAATPINNISIVSADNLASPVSDSTQFLVRGMAGADYTVIPADGSGNAGAVTTLQFTIRNRGNTNETYNLAIAMSATNAAQAGDYINWTNRITDVGGLTITSVALAVGGTADFYLHVRPTALASDGDWKQYKIYATAARFTTATNYASGGTLYGGDIGENTNGVVSAAFYGMLSHGATTLSGATTNEWIRVLIQGPILTVTKRIISVTSPLGAIPVPGATIVYSIKVTNSGAAAAVNPRIFDLIPANTVYIPNTAVNGTSLTTHATNAAISQIKFSGANLNAATVDTVQFSVRIQ